MSKIKYEKVPVYAEVEVFGKTTNGSVFGTVARRDVGRCILTEEAGFDPATEEGRRHKVGDSSNDLIVTAAKVAEKVLFVRLAGGAKSAAEFKFFDCYEAKNRENEGITDVFVKKNVKEVDEIVKCADGMCKAHPECSDRWDIVDKDGNRVFIRIYGEVDKNGEIVRD